MPRKSGTVRTFSELWQRHENLYYSIFYQALNRLEINKKQCKSEDAISEALCPVLIKVCFEHEQDVTTPDWEKFNL